MSKKQIPPDPEDQNTDRADWANVAIIAFRDHTNSDREDLLSDLLSDLMHWADRNNCDFRSELDRAFRNYDAETTGEP